MIKERKGFTLIELLAVIIILGVLMLIAIPSVTEYISNSRKNAYLSSGSAFIDAVAVKVNTGADGGFSFTNSGYAYYVPVSNVSADSCVSLEKGGKSPFGDWTKAYVIVTLNTAGTAYSYYFTALDSAGYALAPKKSNEWLKTDVVVNSSLTFPANNATVTLNGTSYTVKLSTASSGTCTIVSQ